MRRIGGATRGRAARLLAVLATVGAALAVPAVASASGVDNSGPKSVDLKVKKYAVPAVVASGATSITWKIVVSNRGGRDLTDVKVEDAGVTLGTPVSAIDCSSDDDSSGSKDTRSGGKDKSSYKSSNSSDDHSSCTDKPDVLQPGETWTYTATQTIDPATCGTVTNTVKVTATAPKYSDDDEGDDKDKAGKKDDHKTSSSGHTSTYKKSNSTSGSSGGKDDDKDGGHHVVGTQTVTAKATGRAFVSCPAITVTKSAEKASYAQGETITWIVTVKNSGNVPLSSPVITDAGVTFGPPTSDRGGVLVAKRSKHAKKSYTKTSKSSDDRSSCGSTSTYSSKSSSDDHSSCPPPPTCDSSSKTAKSTSSDDHSCETPKPCPDASKSSMSSDDHSCGTPKPCPDASKSSMSRSSSDDHCEAPKPPACDQAIWKHSRKYKHQTSDDHACPPPAGGTIAPGETLTYRGTQTASDCGTVTNTVKVDATALPPGKDKKHRKGKRHGGEYTMSKGMKHDSSYHRTSSSGSYTPPTPPSSTTVSGTATAATFVVCQVTVTKTASLSYTKTFGWTVEKSLAPGQNATITVPAADTATTVPVGYVVKVTKDAGVDSNIGVTGTITVKNPYSDPLAVTLADDILGVEGESCALTPSANVTVPKSGSLDVAYACTNLPSVPAPDTKNQATATFTVNGQPGSATGSAAVGTGTVTAVNDRVAVTDKLTSPALPAPIVTALGNDVAASFTFTPTQNLPVPASGQPCSVFTNVATADGLSLQPKSTSLPATSAPVTVTVCKETTTPGGDPQPPLLAPPGGGTLGTPSTPGTGGTVGGAATTPKTPRPRLVVSKKGPAAAVAGQLVRYTITVRNAGKVTARGVRLRDVLPGGFSVAKKVKGASVSGGAVRWPVGTLAAGKSTTVRVTIRLSRTMSGRRCNVATATASNASTARGQQCTRIAAIAGALDPAVTG